MPATPLPWIVLGAAAWRLLLLAGSPPLQLTPDGIRHLRAAFALFPYAYATWFQAWITPGYATFLWLVSKLAGFGPWPIVIAHSALGLLSVVVYYRLGERCAGPIAGLLVGSYVALHPVIAVFEHCLLTETLALLLQGCALLLAVTVLDNPRRGLGGLPFLAGAVMGATALVRPSLLVICVSTVGVGVGLAVSRRGRPRSLSASATALRTAAMAAAAAIVMAPWLINNAVVHRKYGVVSGVANIGRFVFGLDAGFLRADDPELIALYPGLPAKCETERECGWYVVDALRSRAATEYQIDDWAARVVSRALKARPMDFARAAVRVVGRQMAFDGESGFRDIDDFVSLASDPGLYATSMKGYLDANPDLRTMVVPRTGATCRPVAWLYRHVWRQRFPLLFVAFVAMLPWCVFRADRLIVAAAAGASIVSLVMILAMAGRYVLLVEPLMVVVVVAGGIGLAEWGTRVARAVAGRRFGLVAGAVGAVLVLAVLVGVGPWLGAITAEQYHIETTATLGPRRLRVEGGPAAMRGLAVSATDSCVKVRAKLTLLALGVTSVGGVPTLPSGWDKGCRSLADHSLLKGADYEWHGPYLGAAVPLLTQSLRLEPDSLYVYEMRVRSTAPIVPLYWEVEVGRHLDPVSGFAAWTHLVSVFITPHWDGAAKTAWFSPALALGPGDVWLTQVRLHAVPIPDPAATDETRR